MVVDPAEKVPVKLTTCSGNEVKISNQNPELVVSSARNEW